ncbi:MAG: hypothetical protein ABIU63_13105 [Chitinophagaceae bacterium]
MKSIQPGDIVVHHTQGGPHSGITFNVLQIEGDEALCEFSDPDPEMGVKEIRFKLAELAAAPAN